MKKMIVFDFGKTFYDHKAFETPASAKRALRELRKQGQLVVLAIGRDTSTHYSRPFLDLVNADVRVERNGAKVTADGKMLFEYFADRTLLRRMLDYAEEASIGLGITVGDEDYYINPECTHEAETRRRGQCGRQFKDAWTLLDKKTRTANFIDTEEEVRVMEQTLPTLQLRMFSVSYDADIIEEGISKAEGLKKLCAYYGLEMRDACAFGDSFNGSEMLEEAGVGTVVGNAKEELKVIADYVTDPTDEGGIWNACKHFQLV